MTQCASQPVTNSCLCHLEFLQIEFSPQGKLENALCLNIRFFIMTLHFLVHLATY